jgi:hypothetical protein
MQIMSSVTIPRERRSVAQRDALPRRVWEEFVEMPCLRLTAPQAQRLFALRADVCQRILSGLVDTKVLMVGADGRYQLRADYWDLLAPRRARSRPVAC